MNKVNCFVCKKMGHYVGKYPNRKKKKGGTVATTKEAEFHTMFERECAFLICCTSVEMTPNIWYIENGALRHMTRVREHLTSLRDTEVRMEIALSDDSLVRVARIDIVTFQRDPKGSSLTSGQVIRVRHGKLFKLFFQPLHALAVSNNNNR
jgi:hypothetical protein